MRRLKAHLPEASRAESSNLSGWRSSVSSAISKRSNNALPHLTGFGGAQQEFQSGWNALSDVQGTLAKDSLLLRKRVQLFQLEAPVLSWKRPGS